MDKKPKETFWTENKLREIDKMFGRNSSRQMESHFGKQYSEILQAWEFYQSHKRLLIKKRSKVKNKINYVYYKPARAEGAYEGRSYCNELSFL